MFGNLFAAFLLSASIGVKSLPVTVPVPRSVSAPSYVNVYGSYNFKNVMGDFTTIEDGTYTLQFQELSINNEVVNLDIVPIHRSIENYNIYYCDYIEFNVDDYHCDVDFFVHNYSMSHPITWSYSFDSEDSLADLGAQDYDDLIFEVRQSYLIHDDLAKLFNLIFTTDENVYTHNYSGYYSFNNGLTSTNNPIAVFGYYIFNQRSYTLMFNYGDGVHGDNIHGLYLGYYQVIDETGSNYEGFSIEAITLPFNQNTTMSSNIYMTNVKMSHKTYLRMQNVGVFAYVRDTSYDNTGFKDLLFGIVDTPVYFVSSLLSFELFGVNLFVALTGLLTICCILLLIKKFW